LHLVGYLYWVILRCTDPWILNVLLLLYVLAFIHTYFLQTVVSGLSRSFFRNMNTKYSGKWLPKLITVQQTEGTLFFPYRNSLQGAGTSSVSRFYDYTQTHLNRQDSSGRVISRKQRPLPDKTQHCQETDTHAHGGIRIHNPSKLAALFSRLRPRGHWDKRRNTLNWKIRYAKRGEFQPQKFIFIRTFVFLPEIIIKSLYFKLISSR